MRSERCEKPLDHSVGSAFVRRFPVAMRQLLKVDPTDQTSTFARGCIFLGLALSVSFLIYICVVTLVKQLRSSRGPQFNAFDPVHVRLTHPQARSSSADIVSGSQGTQRGGRRRVIPGVPEQTYEEYDHTRKRSFQPNLEVLLSIPFWKRRSLGSLQTCQEVHPVSVRRASIDRVLGSVGDALKGQAADDLIFSPERLPQIFRRLIQKTSALTHDSGSEEEIEPPLTALLADPDPEETTRRKVAITSGVVALGLVQAGSTLASSIGGDIGPEILVKLESCDEMEELLTEVHVPPQAIFATGVEVGE
jgi:hypothetical protein